MRATLDLAVSNAMAFSRDANPEDGVSAEEAPALYAPSIPPGWNAGPDLHFALSPFGPYNVFWWHTSLDVR